MDSLSQLVLGGCIAAVCAPAPHRRKALLAGAVLGTLPDLDAIPLSLAGVDAVTLMTSHRGASHSLFVLPLAGWLIWRLLARFWQPVRAAPRPWFWAVQLALVTHPILDAFTIYGTQLWWPLPVSPVMGGSLFIIDPLYTLPLLLAFAIALAAPLRPSMGRLLTAGLALSTAYLGWSLIAQSWVDGKAARALAADGLDNAPRFVSPSPFNTLLWRIVVMTPEGFLEGYHSLAVDEKPIRFSIHESDTDSLRAVSGFPAVRRLAWFNRGFMKAGQRDNQLVLSDLRMGAEPDYSFRFAVALPSSNGGWQPIPRPEAVRWPASTHRLSGVWTRLWNEP